MMLLLGKVDVAFADAPNTEPKSLGDDFGLRGYSHTEPVSWGTLIAEAMIGADDQSTTLITTLTQAEFTDLFRDSYASKPGRPFTAWTDERVYFPLYADGAQWVGSAPRNPCNEALMHQGGV